MINDLLQSAKYLTREVIGNIGRHSVQDEVTVLLLPHSTGPVRTMHTYANGPMVRLFQ